MAKNLTIRLKDNGYLTEDELILNALEERDLLRPDFLYSAVNAAKFEEIRQTGTYRKNKNDIFAFTEQALRELTSDISKTTLVEYLDNYNNPGIVIWKKDFFKNIDFEKLGEEIKYRFKDRINKPAAVYALVNVILPII